MLNICVGVRVRTQKVLITRCVCQMEPSRHSQHCKKQKARGEKKVDENQSVNSESQ